MLYAPDPKGESSTYSVPFVLGKCYETLNIHKLKEYEVYCRVYMCVFVKCKANMN